MHFITRLITVIDLCSEWLGRIASWASLLMVLVTCYIVVTRYIFNIGSIAVQESIIYLNAILFILTAGFTLRQNGHVRVDVFYGKASPRYRHWADLLGSLLLLMPVCVFIFVYSWDYVNASWRIGEQSRDPGGLPWVYLLKSLILVLPAVLLCQGLAEVLRNLAALIAPASQAAMAAVDDDEPVVM